MPSDRDWGDARDPDLDLAFGGVSAEVPSRERIDRIRESLSASLTPVKPMPSNWRLLLVCLTGFLILVILETMPFGFDGFLTLRTPERMALYPVLFLAAVLCAAAIPGQMAPGSKRIVSPALATAFAAVYLGVATPLLYHDYNLHHFIERGIPCLRLGTVSAIPNAVLVWFLMRRGFVSNPVTAGTVAGAFSGIVGLSVLALHCPIRNTPHVFVWHVGAFALATLAGAGVGWIVERRGNA